MHMVKRNVAKAYFVVQYRFQLWSWGLVSGILGVDTHKDQIGLVIYLQHLASDVDGGAAVFLRNFL